MPVPNTRGARVDVCVEYDRTCGPLTGAALWQVGHDRWQRCIGLRTRIFRRSNIKRQLTALVNAAGAEHPCWRRAMLKVFVPLHTRHRHHYRYRAWRVRLLADTTHLVLWLPITPRIRLGADVQVYVRWPATRAWISVPDDHVQCWLGPACIVYLLPRPT